MLFMVVERFRNRDALAVYRRFRDSGRMMPEGLEYVGSWVETEAETHQETVSGEVRKERIDLDADQGVVTDRNRGASFLSIGIAGAAIFAVFLFLTYYLQQDRGYTPIRTGVAFLPIAAAVTLTR